jgi:hypothetical protein
MALSALGEVIAQEAAFWMLAFDDPDYPLDEFIPSPQSESDDVVVRPEDLEQHFDLSRTAAPKNRLPRDWKP